MRKWALAATVAFFAVVSVAAGAVAITDDGGYGARVVRDADDRGESDGDGSPNVSAVCAPDVPDCEDMIVDPDDGGAAGTCLEGAVECDDTPGGEPRADDVCIQIFPTPPECADPDEPVSNDPLASDEPPTTPACPEPSVPCVVDACTLQYPNECTGKKAALTDLAARLDVKEDAITVVNVERVDWPDSCLGITTRDIACAEVITPGYRIILEASGQKYEYHTDGGSRAELAE